MLAENLKMAFFVIPNESSIIKVEKNCIYMADGEVLYVNDLIKEYEELIKRK